VFLGRALELVPPGFSSARIESKGFDMGFRERATNRLIGALADTFIDLVEIWEEVRRQARDDRPAPRVRADVPTPPRPNRGTILGAFRRRPRYNRVDAAVAGGPPPGGAAVREVASCPTGADRSSSTSRPSSA
jgi:hypothetical protein